MPDLFNPLPLNTAPEITGLQQQMTTLIRKGGVTRLLVTANLTLEQGKPLTLYCDLSQSFTVTLPDAPVAPGSQDPGIQDYYEVVTLAGDGLLTIAPGDRLINGVNRDIYVPSNRNLELVYLGGDIGWRTPSEYTNRVIGRAVSIWTDGGLTDTPSDLNNLTDGNPGTATGFGRTVNSGGVKAVLYCDLEMLTEVSYFRVTGLLKVRPFGWTGSPRKVGVGFSLDGSSWSYVTQDYSTGDFDAPDPCVFELTQSLTARYVGVVVDNAGSEDFYFSFQEMEVA